MHTLERNAAQGFIPPSKPIQNPIPKPNLKSVPKPIQNPTPKPNLKPVHIQIPAPSKPKTPSVKVVCEAHFFYSPKTYCYECRNEFLRFRRENGSILIDNNARVKRKLIF